MNAQSTFTKLSVQSFQYTVCIGNIEILIDVIYIK